MLCAKCFLQIYLLGEISTKLIIIDYVDSGMLINQYKAEIFTSVESLRYGTCLCTKCFLQIHLLAKISTKLIINYVDIINLNSMEQGIKQVLHNKIRTIIMFQLKGKIPNNININKVSSISIPGMPGI